MVTLLVKDNILTCGRLQFRCAIGASGLSGDKREGDKATPVGTFALRECWYRADRMAVPQTGLTLRVIGKDDGWSDDPGSPEYNRHVSLPYGFSHERLWRDDAIYDVVVPLAYNDDPVVPGKGSAIFMHLARPDYAPTEGCVALARADFLRLLKVCDSGAIMRIEA